MLSKQGVVGHQGVEGSVAAQRRPIGLDVHGVGRVYGLDGFEVLGVEVLLVLVEEPHHGDVPAWRRPSPWRRRRKPAWWGRTFQLCWFLRQGVCVEDL